MSNDLTNTLHRLYLEDTPEDRKLVLVIENDTLVKLTEKPVTNLTYKPKVSAGDLDQDDLDRDTLESTRTSLNQSIQDDIEERIAFRNAIEQFEQSLEDEIEQDIDARIDPS